MLLKMKKISFISLLILIYACNSSEEYRTNCQELDAADLEMISVHKEIMTKYKSEERFLKRLQDAQVYWTQYKDRHIRSLYPLDKKYYEVNYGNTYNQCKCKEATRLTQLRVKELRVWHEGSDQGECPTSII